MEESLKMKALSHPNILNLIGVSIDAGEFPYIIMPYMANGSLLSYLRKERPNLTIAAGASADLVSSISCVHSQCIKLSHENYNETSKDVNSHQIGLRTELPTCNWCFEDMLFVCIGNMYCYHAHTFPPPL